MPTPKGLRCFPWCWALMHCTLPLPSAGSGGWSCSTPCVSQLQNPPGGMLCWWVPSLETAPIHPPMESGQHSVGRLLGAQRSPLVLTHHSEAFWGNAGLGRIPHPGWIGKPQPHREAPVEAGEPQLCLPAAGPTRGMLWIQHHQPHVLPCPASPPLFSPLQCSATSSPFLSLFSV